VPGGSSVLFVVLLLGGIQLITIGIIGEYVGRVYDEVKRRPLYLVRDARNVEPDDAARATGEEPERLAAP
jgi:polyisoprenyl-phosphate glycosyltransferase